MVLADWSKISGADLQLIKKACHLNYGAISGGSESRYIHNGTGNTFYVSQGMSTWFALIKPSSGTVKMKIGGILKYYDNNNYVYSYLEIEVDSAGNIVSAKVIYRKREGGSETVVLEDDVTDKIQHLSGMAGYSQITEVDDFEGGSTEGFSSVGDGEMSVVDGGYEGSKSLMVKVYCGADESKSHHAYKDVSGINWAIIEVLCKSYCEAGAGGCSHNIEGHGVPSDWGYIYVYPTDGTLDIYTYCSATAIEGAHADSRVYVDTIRYIDYLDIAWAFVKFYGYLKQIEGKWYLDIEVRVSNNYYTSPDTSVEPSTSVISSCLVEIPNTIIGNNTKCGVILGREVSDWRGQGYPNIVIDYTKLFY